jgi:hypothetical protein
VKGRKAQARDVQNGSGADLYVSLEAQCSLKSIYANIGSRVTALRAIVTGDIREACEFPLILAATTSESLRKARGSWSPRLSSEEAYYFPPDLYFLP